MEKKLLTLVMPLLDRHTLTNRVLRHLSTNKCPFNIILADGSKNPFFNFFKKPVLDSISVSPLPTGEESPSGESIEKHYEGLSIKYFHSGYDYNISKYMKKMDLAFKEIETPLCMVVDNDDLVDISGIKSGIDFMSKNKEYSSYQNDVKTLNLNPQKHLGPSLYTRDSIEQEDAQDRVIDSIKNFNSFNYAIFRTPICRVFFRIMGKINNDDFQLFQKCWSYFAAACGKCKRLHNESYYYFIPGNSILQHGRRVHKFSNWMDTPYWQSSAPAMISIISLLTIRMDKSKTEITKTREDIAKTFIHEVCDKNGEKRKTLKEIRAIVQQSYDFDKNVKDAIRKSKLSDFEEFKYDNKSEPNYESFLLSL